MDLKTSYEILDLTPGSSFKDIKVAYLAKVKQYHPDQYSHETDNRQIAENKLKDINLAYETLMTSFKDHCTATELSLAVTKAARELPGEKKEDTEKQQHRAAPPESLKKARAIAQKIAFEDIDTSDLFSLNDSQCRHARKKADSTIENRLNEISRTESDLTRYQAWLNHKYFKKNVYEISSDHKFKWKNLKKLIAGSNPYAS